MAGMLQKRISKLLTPLKSRRQLSTRDVVRTLTVVCTADHTTEDVLAQLQDVSQNKHVTCVVLREMIQRSDNVQLFSKIQDLLRESKYFTSVRSIHLVEPHVCSDEYRRWCFKKTNFLHRIRKEAKERHIDVTIHGTLILDSTTDTPSNDTQEDKSTAPQQPQQQLNVSSWLSLLQKLPQDPDITSLSISLRDETGPSTGRHRPSQLELLQSPVQKVFQALVELFNADTRRWQFIHVKIHYQQQTMIQQEQTQSLLEVAELFHIPLKVQWRPTGSSSDARIVQTSRTTAHSTCCPQEDNKAHPGEDDNTSTTSGMDGSSGALTAGSHPKRPY